MMNILRAEHSAEYPYVMMSKATANNRGLSLAARGLLAWLLDKPDSWNIDPDAIARLNDTTLYEIKKLLNELTRGGYLTPPQRQHVKGRWQYTPYVLRETPNATVDVEIEIPENSDTETDALLQSDCNSMTVFDNLPRAEDKHEIAAEQITKTNNNSNHSEQETTKTDNPPVANPELPADAPVSLSVSENPEQSPIIELDNPHGEPGQEKHQPPEARAIVPPAGIFVLEETPSKHEAAAQLQPVQSEVSSAPPPVRVTPLPEPEPVKLFENFLTDEFEDDREIPGLKPGDPPLYKPTPGWNRIMAAHNSVVGPLLTDDMSEALNIGLKLRGVQKVIDLILKAEKKAGNPYQYVLSSLQRWPDEKQPEHIPLPGQKPHDDGIIWNDDGSLGGYT